MDIYSESMYIRGLMKTIARKKQTEKPIELPSSWIESVKATLEDAYRAECEEKKLHFDIMAGTFPDEVLICLSLMSTEQPEQAPCTLMLSADIEKNMAPNKVLKTLIDQAGFFFDTYFQTSEDERHEVYQARWLEEKHNNQEFFVRVSRENVRLTLEANKWLD